MKTKDKIQNTVPKLALTRGEAAQALGLSVVTIDRLTQRGLLKPSRHTRRPLYSLAELTRFTEVPTDRNKANILEP
jgi:MerR HTH family regulatory protein